jgi:putative ABC transport system permease protein
MTTALHERPSRAGGHGGLPARRAVMRWAWRMFRREWRQQFLVLALITVAVGATVVGAAVATDTPPPAGAGFGTATDLATFGGGPQLARQIASLRQRFGRVDVIENQAMTVPGSIETFTLRAQDPHGPFGQSMLSLISGRYPAGPGQAALTPDLARTLNLKAGDLWSEGGKSWRVTGIVTNPQSLLDEFALVAPGQVTTPTQVTVLFDAPEVKDASIGPTVVSRQSAAASNPLNPETIVLGLATVGMLLIALVAAGGFTVLAQRRLRSLGMLGSLGATDRNIRLVVRVNGLLVGLAGAAAGFVIGMAAWLAYRPRLESSVHHLIGVFQVPWAVIGPALVLAVLASFLASGRPARSVTRMPVVAALSGRPAPPKGAHRSVVPGLAAMVAAAALLAYGGHSVNGGGALFVVVGLVVLVAGVILIAPLGLAVLGRLARPAPVAVRLALRDLARYRARSGSALSAISLGVFIAALVCVLAAQRYGNPLDYAGPNLASNQIIVYTAQGGPGPGPGGSAGSAPAPSMKAQTATAQGIAGALGGHDMIALEQAAAHLQHAEASGRQWSGTIYVATPQLLAAFGISPSQVQPDADILTMRPGLSGVSQLQLLHGDKGGQGASGPNGPQTFPCPASSCLASPVIQEVSALPSGTSAPNTMVTEHAVQEFGLQTTTDGWLLQLTHPPTATQIRNARLTAAGAGMSIETKSSTPAASEIIDWATVFGIALALGILAMTVGLIRSETASDLRTLTAAGASAWTRRTLTAATAGGQAQARAIHGVLAAYVGAIGYAWDNPLDGLSELSSIPLANLLVLLIGMPVAAAAIGWLLAGREPDGLARQPA